MAFAALASAGKHDASCRGHGSQEEHKAFERREGCLSASVEPKRLAKAKRRKTEAEATEEAAEEAEEEAEA